MDSVEKDVVHLDRAYSVFEIKRASDDQRVVEGLATTPEADRHGDIVEPRGAVFKLPLPLLWQHNSQQPVGTVTSARVTDAGIAIVAQISKIAEAGTLKDRVDEAWHSIKEGLVRGLSIGFRPLESERTSNGQRFTSWEWLELSVVTIPANAGSGIQAIKSACKSALPDDIGRLYNNVEFTKAFMAAWKKSLAERKEDIARGIDVKGREHPGLHAAGIHAIMTSVTKELKAISLYSQQKFDDLSARIIELEAKPTLKYAGVYSSKEAPYDVGEFVTHNGSLWHCWECTSEAPGSGSAWQLAVKRGRDAKERE